MNITTCRPHTVDENLMGNFVTSRWMCTILCYHLMSAKLYSEICRQTSIHSKAQEHRFYPNLYKSHLQPQQPQHSYVQFSVLDSDQHQQAMILSPPELDPTFLVKFISSHRLPAVLLDRDFKLAFLLMSVHNKVVETLILLSFKSIFNDRCVIVKTSPTFK